MPIEDYSGAVAVVTGGASGIGLATARALVAQGAHVALADVNEEGLQAAADDVRAHGTDPTTQVIAVVTDVTDEAQVRELMRRALELTGRLDLVVACAGIGRGGRIDDLPASEMRRMLDVNVMGVYHCVQAALPAMRAQGSGQFVLLSSVAGKLGVPTLSGYCASKWAVRGFSIAMRAELYGSGVGITTVYPAWVDTPMFRAATEQSDGLELRVMLTPEQVADEILKAAQEGRRDLTLAPNPDIALLIERTKSDPDRAEDSAGRAFQRRQAQNARNHEQP
ncbi:MAG TPA: SDR family oxidoreductase [Ktedonobacterales bacterium]|nr:SDR family oxidoreductase [Ktedonobacterales bacterium]